MSDPLSAGAGLAKDVVLNVHTLSALQKLIIFAIVVACFWATHWVWLPRLDCHLKIKNACGYLESRYDPVPRTINPKQ